MSQWLYRFARKAIDPHVKTTWELVLTSIESKLLSGISSRQLFCTREKCGRKNQPGFRPSGNSIHHIFTLRQMLEYRQVFHKLTNFVFLGLKVAFDPIDHAVPWHWLSLRGVLQKCISLIQFLYSNSRNWVRAYGDLSSELIISRFHQRCPFSTLPLRW